MKIINLIKNIFGIRPKEIFCSECYFYKWVTDYPGYRRFECTHKDNIFYKTNKTPIKIEKKILYKFKPKEINLNNTCMRFKYK